MGASLALRSQLTAAPSRSQLTPIHSTSRSILAGSLSPAAMPTAGHTEADLLALPLSSRRTTTTNARLSRLGGLELPSDVTFATDSVGRVRRSTTVAQRGYTFAPRARPVAARLQSLDCTSQQAPNSPTPAARASLLVPPSAAEVFAQLASATKTSDAAISDATTRTAPVDGAVLRETYFALPQQAVAALWALAGGAPTASRPASPTAESPKLPTAS